MSKDRAVLCLYCGQNINYDSSDEASRDKIFADFIEHDAQCKKNPLVQRIEFLTEAIRARDKERLRRIDEGDGCIYCDDAEICGPGCPYVKYPV